jgi:hypothetical protein
MQGRKAFVKKLGNKKQWFTRGSCAALLALVLCARASFSQCYPEDNAYVFFHPAFANKNWAQTSYDSILIMPFDSMCGLAPAAFDICGDPQNATGVFIGQDRKLYLVTSAYSCPGGCTPCQLQYDDPVPVSLPGITLAQNSPLYLVKKQGVYGKDSVKVLVATSLKQALGLTISTASATVLKRDTLKLSALAGGQDIVRIQGEYDSVDGRDTAVWVLGARGLARRFPLPASGLPGAEAKRDVGTDTVYCVGNGYAGTSSGTIYKSNGGGAFSLDSKPCSDAIMYINAKGAAGKNGAFLEFTAGAWQYTKIGTADYIFANFTNRWDGAGVELVDASWKKTAVTYRDFPSRIASTSPFTYSQGMTYQYTTKVNEHIVVTMADPDNSFTDFQCTLNGGTMKNDGKYAILNIPGTSLCAKDSVRIASGVISLTLDTTAVTVSAQCKIGKYIPLCQSTSWKDYSFVNSRSWYNGDALVITAGTNQLTVRKGLSTVNLTGRDLLQEKQVSVSHRFAGGSLVFQVRQGTAQKLKKILLYNLRGQTVASLQGEKSATLSVPGAGACGMVYAKFVFSDGSIACRPIVLVR